MAELSSALGNGARLSAAQFRAIIRLRWRIFANGFRRKGGWAEFLGRLLLFPLLAMLLVLPAVGAGFAAWELVSNDAFAYFSLLFWAVFLLAQLLNINLGQPGTTFDPSELIRFPMTLRSFILVRLWFGLLSPANVVVLLMGAGIFCGATLARPALWPWVLLITGVFALANLLFSRMVFAWVDRWLATRRSREIFTALVFVSTLLFQYLNVTYNPGFQHGRQSSAAFSGLSRWVHWWQAPHPLLAWLPPELTSAALLAAARHHHLQAGGDVLLVLLYACGFLLVYARRMRTEYRGENLSDAANAVQRARTPPFAHTASAAISAISPAEAVNSAGRLSPLLPMLRKELLVLRRNTGLLYGVVAPAVMVFLFAGRLSFRGNSPWVLDLAVAYALLGIAPLSYNSFGLEGEGAQLYFLAPVPLREVFLAKNLMQFGLALFEVASIVVILSLVTRPPGLAGTVFVLLWATATLLLNTTVGNLRSVSAPKKVAPGKPMNRAQSQLSVWMAIGILVSCAGLGASFQLLATLTGRPWLSLVLVLLFAVAAALAYAAGLRGMDSYANDRRESLFEELGKKS